VAAPRTTTAGDPFAETTKAQAAASDPAVSAWVGANAGTGKTHVLTMRVLRLLMAGAAPERILCLTYTKAAAAEMSNRVYAELQRWTSAPMDRLAAALKKLLGRAPTERELPRARALFASVLETPGGLKIQTIHSFAQRLLERCPLEAGVPPGLKVLDDDQARRARREAVDAVLREAAGDRTSRLGRALDCAVRHAAGDGFDGILREALGQREWLGAMRRYPNREDPDLWDGAGELYRRLLGVRPRLARETIDRELSGVLDDDALRQTGDALAQGSANDRKAADKIARALAAASANARVEALQDFFLTGKGEARKSLMTKAAAAANPALAEQAGRAQEAFRALEDERRALDVADATTALLEIADAVMQRYTAAKAEQAAFDFDDLVEKTARLLNPAPYGAPAHVRDWALHKLDGGLDHILVDEAQDTSPAQWDIVEALASGFLSSENAGRTIFGVGDRKQSIYGFQGAAPEMFAQAGRRFAERAAGADQTWRDVGLTASFRTVAPVLDAVDEVFRDAARTPGLGGAGRRIRHIAHRTGQAGLVEIWPVEEPDDAMTADPWSPLDETASTAPSARLAGRIARTVRGWLDTGETLPSQDRPIRAGDILILVRRRRPFSGAMVAALEAARVPVAGADRLRVLDEISAADLMALGDALLLPENDLQLAAVLKGPLFGLDDGDLFTLAHGRPGSLWASLATHGETDPRYAEALAALKRWRTEAALLPPFEFYANVLDRDGGRNRMLARLGPEAADPLDEFLNLALGYDEDAAPSLSGFLRSVRASEREIKRDMDQGQDAVRVMTVHGAKGLEAPIVFLPDTCGAGGGHGAGLLPLMGAALPEGLPQGLREVFVWGIKGAGRVAAVAAARAGVEEREAHERQRLLYVAMTRARDRLYVAGYRGRHALGADCWYTLISEALAPHLETVETSDGGFAGRLSSPQTAKPEAAKGARETVVAPAQRPKWSLRSPPREEPAPARVTPSSLAPYEKETGEEAAPAGERPAPVPAGAGGGGDPFLRGTLTHALLEHLPSLPPDRWPDAGLAYLARRGAALDPNTLPEIVRQALAILRDPEFAPLFGPQSRAEVAISALVPRPDGGGPPLHVHGQIDRLALVGDEALVIDYKTNRAPPETVADAPEAYLMQLASYRLALKRVFPRFVTRAAILWTAGPRLMKIPAEALDACDARIWGLWPPPP